MANVDDPKLRERSHTASAGLLRGNLRNIFNRKKQNKSEIELPFSNPFYGLEDDAVSMPKSIISSPMSDKAAPERHHGLDSSFRQWDPFAPPPCSKSTEVLDHSYETIEGIESGHGGKSHSVEVPTVSPYEYCQPGVPPPRVLAAAHKHEYETPFGHLAPPPLRRNPPQSPQIAREDPSEPHYEDLCPEYEEPALALAFSEPWFYVDLLRQNAVEMLSRRQAGTFLVRTSQGRMAISVVDPKGTVRHVPITQHPSGDFFCPGDDFLGFKTIAALAQYYERHKLTKDGVRCLCPLLKAAVKT